MFLTKAERYIKEVFSLILRLLLVPTIIREVICRNKVTIIQYHNVKPPVFKKYLTYLNRHYNIISLDCLVSAIRQNSEWRVLPEKSLVITMDDGFHGNYDLIPVLDEFRIPVIIFVRTEGINMDYNQESGERKYLNKKEMLELLKHNVSLGAHTMAHPYLSKIIDKDAYYEINSCKEYLEKYLSIKIRHFAYPYGDYTKRDVDILKDLTNYISARTVKPGWIDKKSKVYELKCMGIGDNVGINKMILDVVGIFPFLRIIRRKFSSINFANKYKTPISYITGLLNLRGLIAQHTKKQAGLIRKYAKGKKRLVEIGAGEGGSALVGLSVMDPEGRMWLIDPYRSLFYPFFSLSLKIIKRALSKLNDRDITLIRDYSYNVVKTWNTKIDYLLIDAHHSEEGFIMDWQTWSPFVTDNGVILAQSIQSPSGIETGAAKALRKILENNDKWIMIDKADATLVIGRKP